MGKYSHYIKISTTQKTQNFLLDYITFLTLKHVRLPFQNG